MVKSTLRLFLWTTPLLLFLSCNPDCESLPTQNILLPPGPYQEGTELAIAANPPNFIEGRSIHLSMRESSGTTTQELESRFEESVGAMIVKLPDQVNSSATFWVDDPDCSGQLLPIGETTSLVDESFFVDNPFFITPTPPLIIIPTPPVVTPPNIVNAWFSPQNRDYCIWFKPDEDENGGEKSNLIPAIADGPMSVINGPPEGSVELAVGCGGMPAIDRYYHANPVSGIVDKENNYIRITIDRTMKGLGVEEFEGQFINPDDLPPGYALGGPNGNCGSVEEFKPHIMFLTSLQTGRQMILYRGLD